MCWMRRTIGLVSVTVVLAGCIGGASHHATMSASQALAQARADGFVRPALDRELLSYKCDGHFIDVGPPQTTGRYADYVHPSYALGFSDRRVRNGPENVARIAIRITVFHDAAMAARCAHASIYDEMHPTGQYGGNRLSRRMLDPTTIVIDEHAAGRRGDMFADDTGQYDTFFAKGRVFAQGLAYNVPHSKIVREDLERLAAEIAG